MFVIGSSKAVLGGSVFLGTGIGAGGVILASSSSRVTNPTSNSSKGGCRIHQLMSSDSGTFQEVKEETLEQEILGLRQGNYFQQIKESCKEVGDKDIFISNKNKTGWKYYSEDQETNTNDLKNKFQIYLQGKKSK